MSVAQTMNMKETTMTTLTIRLLLLCTMLFASAPAWATTYYVATTGSDTLNNGLSVGAPYATPQRV